MKEKPNYDEIEKQIDFKVLTGRLNALSEKNNRQRKTVFDVLDNVREEILSARQKRKVSYCVLAKELTAAGVPVSEPTLRKYIHAQGIGKKRRKIQSPANENSKGGGATPETQTETKSEKPTRQHRFNLNV
jgi:hypothetical protein